MNPMLNNIQAVLFDMDGTLIDSMWVWKQIDEEFLGRMQIDLPESLAREIEGMSFSETACYFRDHFPIELSAEEIMDYWTEMAREKYLTEVPLKDGVSSFLRILKGLGIRTGIATSNSRLLTEAVLQALQISDCFDCIITAEEIQKGKPSPEIYLKAADQLQIVPEQCLVFEDIPAGIIAGKRAGMKVCAVEDPFSCHLREEKQELADYFIDSFQELQTENKQ